MAEQQAVRIVLTARKLTAPEQFAVMLHSTMDVLTLVKAKDAEGSAKAKR